MLVRWFVDWRTPDLRYRAERGGSSSHGCVSSTTSSTVEPRYSSRRDGRSLPTARKADLGEQGSQLSSDVARIARCRPWQRVASGCQRVIGFDPLDAKANRRHTRNHKELLVQCSIGGKSTYRARPPLTTKPDSRSTKPDATPEIQTGLTRGLSLYLEQHRTEGRPPNTRDWKVAPRRLSEPFWR